MIVFFSSSETSGVVADEGIAGGDVVEVVDRGGQVGDLVGVVLVGDRARAGA